MDFVHSVMKNGGIKSRPAKTKPWQLFLGLFILIVIVLAATSSSSNIVKDNLAVVTGTGTTTTSLNTNENLCSVSKPMQVTSFNALSGAALNANQLEIRNGASPYTVIQNASASSSGVVTTAATYTTGTALKMQTYAASTVRQWLDFTVPPMTCGDNATNNVVSIYAIVLGAWTPQVTGAGSTFQDGPRYLITQFTGNSVDITFTLAEDTANAGYKTSFDPIRNAYYNFVIELSTAGTSLTIEGFQKSAVKGSTTYYFKVCPDGLKGSGSGKTAGTGAFAVSVGSQSVGTALGCNGSLTEQTVGTDVIGGVAAFTFTIKQGALTAGVTQDLDVRWLRNADIDKYIATNDYGPYDAQVGSTFDLNFVA